MVNKFIPLIFLVPLVLFFSGCTSSQVGPVCNPPYILKGYGCCLDQNGNSVCDDDEQQPPAVSCGDGTCQSNEGCLSCPQDCGECEITEISKHCGDDICSPEENICEYDIELDRYKRMCQTDCGHNCSAKIVLSSNLSKSEETYSYDCSGYKEEVCNKTGDNKFTLKRQSIPYKASQRGIHTVVKNVGEKHARTVSSSFECYAEDKLVLSSDEDFYKGVPVEDYFYSGQAERQSVDVLYPVYPPGADEWYSPYYLDFDIRFIERDFDLVCNVTLTSVEPEWTNIQTIEISFEE